MPEADPMDGRAPHPAARRSVLRAVADPRAAVVLLLLALGFVGFTGSSWWYVATGDPLSSSATRAEDRNLVGLSRPIRSDEYGVDLPLARAQQLARPRFPLVNLNLGLGGLQRNPFGTPVLDWGIAFRPYLWPLLIGDRWSHGVRWFLRLAVLALGLFAWFEVAAGRAAGGARDRRRSAVAAVAAVAVLFSSALVWWLGHPTPEILGLSGIVVWAVDRRARAMTPLARAGWTVAVVWTAAAAFFSFYAPMWAPVLWLLAGCALDSHRDAARDAGSRRALPGALVSLGAIAVGVVISILYYAPYLVLVLDTIYPGRRVSAPGEQPLSRLVELAWPSLHAYAPLHLPEQYVGNAASNVCEASAVEVLPLFLLPVLAATSARVRSCAIAALRARPGLTVAWGVLAAWTFAPLPKAFGWLTLLRWTPGLRAWVPFGIATALLVASILAELASSPAEPGSRIGWRSAGGAAAVLALLLFVARGQLPGGSPPSWAPMATAAVLLVIGSSLVRTRWAGLALALAWAVPIVAVNVQVNPLLTTRDLFVEGPGHAAVSRALKVAPGRILDLGTHGGAALAGYGWPVLATVDTTPEPSLWRFLAPAASELTPMVWNRFAHVRFVLPPLPTSTPTPDSIQVQLDPCSPALAAIGVNHILTDRGLPAACAVDYVATLAGNELLWSRRVPVGMIGLARGVRPTSALEFDWSAEVPARVTARRDRLVLEGAGDPSNHYAFALNLAVIDEISCERASAVTMDTHVVVSPAGGGTARCEIRFLGTVGALRRVLSRR